MSQLDRIEARVLATEQKVNEVHNAIAGDKLRQGIRQEVDDVKDDVHALKTSKWKERGLIAGILVLLETIVQGIKNI